MIVDTLSNLPLYDALVPAIATVQRFLDSRPFAALESGRCEIDGERLYATVIRDRARSPQEGQLEAHRRYLDIQILMKGAETMGWKPLEDCRRPLRYDAETDLQFFEDEAQVWLAVAPGQFALFLPGDAHCPMCGSGELEKLVIKLRVD